jgi:hypothetical protein
MDELTATALDTKIAVLTKSKRKQPEVPIRAAFVQMGPSLARHAGPLAGLVRRHDWLALDLFLLSHAVASARPFHVRLPAPVWARAFKVPTTTVSKAWRRLDELHLVSRAKHGRLAEITVLREDGSGEKYTHPAEDRERYFKLTFRYWYDEWDVTLSLRAKAVLLIALSLRDGFVLPEEKAPSWYGISADTVGLGLNELERCGLITSNKVRKKAPLAPRGYTLETHYSLRPPFAQRNSSRALVGLKLAESKNAPLPWAGTPPRSPSKQA